MISRSIQELKLKEYNIKHVCVKEAVFPFARFQGTDIILGPEMKSTGEVMGIDKNFELAFYKSQLGSNIPLPKKGKIFISIKDEDKRKIIEPAKSLVSFGFELIATSGTATFLKNNKISCEIVKKVFEGRPNVVDLMISNEIDLVINTVEGLKSIEDSFSLRQTALLNNIPYYTTIQGAIAVTSAIKSVINKKIDVHSLQSYLN
jgi:carbamoyl-phosphate synthase large subunit